MFTANAFSSDAWKNNTIASPHRKISPVMIH
jgi:hypothetical protein